MMTFLRTPVVSLAALSLAALVLTGCSSGSPGTSPRPTKTTSADSVKAGEEWVIYQGPQDCGVVGQDPSSICIERPDGTGRHKLLPSQSGELLHPDWSPDGNTIAFVAGDGREIWTASVDGTHAKKVADCGTFNNCNGVDFPSFSPDGKTIAFTVYDGSPLPLGPPSKSEIALLDLATGKSTTIGQTAAQELIDQPRWSHDGTRLAVQLEQFDRSGTETGAAIGILSAAGGAAAPIIPFTMFGTYPDWNPTSGTIVFNTNDVNPAGGPVDLYVVGADGTGLTKLGYDGSDAQQSKQPSWTPDGSKLVFVQWESRTLTFITPDGTSKTAVAGLVSHPRLRPLP